MYLLRDLYPNDLASTLEAARGINAPFEEFNRRHDWVRVAGLTNLGHSRTAFDFAAVGRNPILERMRALGALSDAKAALDLVDRDLFPGHMLDQARRISDLAKGFALPDLLERFRTPHDAFMDKVLLLSLPGFEVDTAVLSSVATVRAFTQASAVADMFASTDRLTRSIREATGHFAVTEMPEFANLIGYRHFFDAAGLGLQRWPRRRLLSVGEKRRRLKARLQANTAPPHVKRAKSLVHRYELTLREVLYAVLAEAYGEGWPQERLPLCDCKDLLKKWEKRGGEVLDHADYAHYARIMSHPEHFEAIFEAGFDDPAAVFELLNEAGSLRAASHHARAFTPEDLRDLRLTWKQIETGLLSLTPDYEMDWDT